MINLDEYLENVDKGEPIREMFNVRAAVTYSFKAYTKSREAAAITCKNVGSDYSIKKAICMDQQIIKGLVSAANILRSYMSKCRDSSDAEVCRDRIFKKIQWYKDQIRRKEVRIKKSKERLHKQIEKERG